MAYSIVFTPGAVDDIDKSVEYYTSLLPGLDFMFSAILDAYFSKYYRPAYCFSNTLRQYPGEAIDTFPYVIHYTFAGSGIIIVRIFNTFQQPYG